MATVFLPARRLAAQWAERWELEAEDEARRLAELLERYAQAGAGERLGLYLQHRRLRPALAELDRRLGR
jgi:hypothetical protein